MWVRALASYRHAFPSSLLHRRLLTCAKNTAQPLRVCVCEIFLPAVVVTVVCGRLDSGRRQPIASTDSDSSKKRWWRVANLPFFCVAPLFFAKSAASRGTADRPHSRKRTYLPFSAGFLAAAFIAKGKERSRNERHKTEGGRTRLKKGIDRYRENMVYCTVRTEQNCVLVMPYCKCYF